jgi:peptidoglycan/xylan/chitin deacetylase (PgdA/CDA1 family)
MMDVRRAMPRVDIDQSARFAARFTMPDDGARQMRIPDFSYPRRWRWPQGQKIAMSVGLAFEAFAHHSQFNTLGSARVAATKPNPLSLSYADYAWKSGIWRLLETLDRYDLKGNMSVSGKAAQDHPKVVAAVAQAGHEVNGHGWVNDVLIGGDDPEAERAEIRRCTKALADACGIPPVGWTGPGSTGSPHTLAILKSEGYLWNGDDASDDLPFVRQTVNGPMVIMPRTNSPHNDLTMWLLPRNPPSIIWEGFKNTFDQLYAEGEAGSPKWIEITLHSHIAGRPTLQPVIRQCLDYARQHDDVWFARRRNIAEWTLEHEKAA